MLKPRKEFDEKTNIRETWVEATCCSCGNTVEFGHEQKKIVNTVQKGFYVMNGGKHFWDAEDGRPLVEMDIFRINKKGKKDPSGKAIKIMAV